MLTENSPIYRVKLDHFEGPLDLLLYLIKKNELDICEVSLTRIGDQYLEYVNTMQILNLEVAGEFILVAATLMLLKSRALLPTDGAAIEDDDDEVESPAELIRRLLLYKKYKEGSFQLRERLTLNDSVFIRDVADPILEGLKGEAPTLEVSIFVLLEAFKKVLQQVPKDAVHEIRAEPIAIGERIRQIFDLLKARSNVDFIEIFAGKNERGWLIVSFLAILEMARLALVRIYQNENFRGIRLELAAAADALENPRVQVLLGAADEAFAYRRDAEAETPPEPKEERS